MRIVLTGGGTGGHLTPLIAVAKKIREIVPEVEFYFIGPKGKLEDEIMGRENIPIRNIQAGKLRRYFSFQNVTDFFKIPFGILKSMWLLLVLMPDAIFSKGGYASFPVVVVGWLYRIPIMIHESDSNPGLANSMLGKFSDRVAVSYPEAEKYFPAAQVVLTGNPLSEKITQGDVNRARQTFNLTESKKVIFVTGGSQGAKSINDKILRILPQLLHKYQIIHQTGEHDFENVVHMAGELGFKAGREGYYPIAFIKENIEDVLAVADLVISRGSATTISEIAANKKPAILIPLETSASDHQRMNAYSLARIGGCIVMEESNMGEHMLLEKIDELMENEALREKLAENIATFYHPDATEKIAQGILGMIKE
ncbi:MAG: undecaprenyldiphospho-muramoylpentapeptide beta-N-acetylglucosaminyltransferase [Parcubacteria group bacterium]|jgi:UDP-N-acetylglucosamine--N-acetylmuramyl-(pentapeptide) pyrophosphoryl-undecaprenol N-acetylglucosamine transferase